MSSREFYFSNIPYKEIEIMRTHAKRKYYFDKALDALETALIDTDVQNLLLGNLKDDNGNFNIHFLSKEPRTMAFCPSERANRIMSKEKSTMDDVVAKYHENLQRGRVYLGIHNVTGPKIHEYTLGAYTECCNHVLYVMKWKKNSTGICFIDNITEFKQQAKAISRGDFQISTKHLRLVKTLMTAIYNTKYEPEEQFKDDTFYDALCQNEQTLRAHHI